MTYGEALAVLRKCEWSASASYVAGEGPCCPVCTEEKDDGHKPDCKLASLVYEVETIADQDWDAVRQACRMYMDFKHSADYHGDGVDDYKQMIFKAAMIAVYGGNVFHE